MAARRGRRLGFRPAKGGDRIEQPDSN